MSIRSQFSQVGPGARHHDPLRSEDPWSKCLRAAGQQHRLKKTRRVFQTAGVPPSMGSAILASIGSTRKSNAALTNMDTATTISTTGFRLPMQTFCG